MFNVHNKKKNKYMLNGSLKRRGYDWWWHSFTALDSNNNEVPFFLEFYIINPKYKKKGLNLGLNDHKPCFLMIKFGHWGKNKKELNYFIDLNKVNIKHGSNFKVEALNCFLSEDYSKGSFVIDESTIGFNENLTDLGSCSWDLKIKKDIAWNVGYGTSDILRDIKAFQMYWHAEGMKTSYSGKIVFDNETYNVLEEKSYGYADKNWGRGFTSPWVWLSSNNIYSNMYNKQYHNSAFDIGGGRPKVYLLPLNRKLLSGIYLEGKEYEFNFSKFWTHTKTKFSCNIDDEYVYWYVKQQNKKYLYESTFKCKKEDMIHVRYIDPHGLIKFHNLWNGGNGVGNIKLYKRKKKLEIIDDLYCKNVGCEYGEFD